MAPGLNVAGAETCAMAAIPASTILTFTLIKLPDCSYQLRKPIIAQVEEDEAGFVVYEESTGVSYYDRDWKQTIPGFVKALVDQFQFLLDHENRLSPSHQAELERFRLLVEKRPVTAPV
jgi:hypothetical protein